MTPPRDSTVATTSELETVDQLRARVAELERQLKSRPSRAPAEQPSPGHPGQTAALAFLGGTVLITAPLAALTLKRWWRWWME